MLVQVLQRAGHHWWAARGRRLVQRGPVLVPGGREQAGQQPVGQRRGDQRLAQQPVLAVQLAVPVRTSSAQSRPAPVPTSSVWSKSTGSTASRPRLSASAVSSAALSILMQSIRPPSPQRSSTVVPVGRYTAAVSGSARTVRPRCVVTRCPDSGRFTW
jgi:hypothetical protein